MHSTLLIVLSVALVLPVTGQPVEQSLPIEERNLFTYASAVIGRHNYYRSLHDAPGLGWDQTLANYAAQTAATCVFGDNTSVGGGGYGQNVAADGSTNASPSDNIDAIVTNVINNNWYAAEVNLFNPYYGKPSVPIGNYLHFTQMVWKASGNVGCASHYCPDFKALGGLNSWYTVCNYVTQGNVEGEFNVNVSPAKAAR